MKKLIIPTLIISTMVVFSSLTGCEKINNEPDGGDACNGITCLNGGTCSDGTCDCTEGWTGNDCGTQKTPTKITITKFTVTKFPATDNGYAWDVFSNGPDIYLKLYKGQTKLYTSTRMEEASSNIEYEWQYSVSLTSPTATYQIVLMDYDSTSDDDFMGSIMFTPYNSTNKFPSVLNISRNGFDMTLTLTYTW